MDFLPELVKLLGILLGGGAMGAIVVKWMNRPIDEAEIKKIHAEAQELGAKAAETQVNTLMAVINNLRSDSESYRAELNLLRERIDTLEERERHALTRAAVHEAWDQMAFQLLIMQNPNHPPPPPLLPSKES